MTYAEELESLRQRIEVQGRKIAAWATSPPPPPKSKSQEMEDPDEKLAREIFAVSDAGESDAPGRADDVSDADDALARSLFVAAGGTA